MTHAKNTLAKWLALLTLLATVALGYSATQNTDSLTLRTSIDKPQVICHGHTGTCP